MQVSLIVVQRMLPTSHTVDHYYCYVKNGDAEDHQCQRNFRTAYNREDRQTQTQELRATVTHEYLRRVPVVRQKAENCASEDCRENGNTMLSQCPANNRDKEPCYPNNTRC